jgi:cell division protein FtsX
MALVGASEFAIKVPFIISGGIQGFCGGALSAIVLYVSIIFAKRYINAMYFDMRLVPFLMGLGLFLGVLASFRSIPAEEHL